MTIEEHKERHKILHDHLDELFADYIGCGGSKLSTEMTVYELMCWSMKQKDNPDDWEDNHGDA